MSAHDGPAFPVNYSIERPDGSTSTISGEDGMSLRDYFAGEALLGLLTHSMSQSIYKKLAHEGVNKKEAAERTAAMIAKLAYLQADAMLSERVRQEPLDTAPDGLVKEEGQAAP